MENVWAAFLARVKPVSTIANPVCMNMTRKPASKVHTKLMEILLWPTVSITSAIVGFAGSLTGTSAAVPVMAPVGSGGLGVAAAAGAATGAVDAVAAGAAGSVTAGATAAAEGDGSWARAPIVRSANTPMAMVAPRAKLRTKRLRLMLLSTDNSFLTVRPLHAHRCGCAPPGRGR